MTPVPFGAILEELIRHLRAIGEALAAAIESSESERVRLLAGALAEQHAALVATVERLQDKLSVRVLGRTVIWERSFAGVALADDADSRAVTSWLVRSVSGAAEEITLLREERRMRVARGALNELHALLEAHGRRIAIEAHRFEDL